VKTLKMWVLVRANGSIVEWFGAAPSRAVAIRRAVGGCISASEYEARDNDEQRWTLAVKRGYRIRRAVVEVQS